MGVSKSSNSNEIKKAYYQLAKQYHPDTNKDEKAKEKFVEIQEAYEILSDDKKRAQYDQFGHASDSSNPNMGYGNYGNAGGFGGFGGFESGNPFGRGGANIFDELFNAWGGSSSSRQSTFSRGQDISASLNLGFMESVKGTKKPISVETIVNCEPCSGSGLKSGVKPTKCHVCGGTGEATFQKSGFMFVSTCTECGGQGKTVPPGSNCRSCGGKGRVRERKNVTVDIPPGVEDGSRIRLQQKGHAPLNGKGSPGDLFVTIKVFLLF